MSKLTIRTISLLALFLLAGVRQASAQAVSAYFGLGSAFDSAATSSGCPSQQISDPFGGLIPPASCVPAQTMGGVFGVFGADFMIKPHLGVNGEYSFRFAQANYLPNESFNVRPGFYDFNAVYQPTAGDKRVVPVLEGGIGGAKLSFYVSQQAGSIFTQSQFFTSTNHFQVHGAVGVKLYIKSDIFIKPQFDIHYVPNLTDQYGRNTVPEVTVSIGYTFGRQ
ncbi:MAG: outer membrane beta-barrel protein [Candidatus Acidiferrales bacterium]